MIESYVNYLSTLLYGCLIMYLCYLLRVLCCDAKVIHVAPHTPCVYILEVYEVAGGDLTLFLPPVCSDLSWLSDPLVVILWPTRQGVDDVLSFRTTH